MISFDYKLNDPMGFHARPTGQLVKEAKKFESQINLTYRGKQVNALRMMAIMGLGTIGGDMVTVTVEGKDEEAAASAIKELLEKTV